MDQADIIHDLLNWLEGHLDHPLTLDNVAAKAGYSKWHLQRMFKDVTGQAIGAYIRARRLSNAAAALRLTSRPILDIALQYRFDSQQTFTRAFKKQFNKTPALYRRAEEWHAYGIRPPIRLGDYTIPTPEFITLPSLSLVGVTQSYTCTLEQICRVRTELRTQFWRDFCTQCRISAIFRRCCMDCTILIRTPIRMMSNRSCIPRLWSRTCFPDSSPAKCSLSSWPAVNMPNSAIRDRPGTSRNSL